MEPYRGEHESRRGRRGVEANFAGIEASPATSTTTIMVSASSIRAAVDSATFDLAGQDVSSILHGDDL